MASSLLWLLVGPNGAGKSTYYERVVASRLRVPFVNADDIARGHWPGAYNAHVHEAAQLAAATRDKLLAARHSFVAESVFSHPSKLALIRSAKARDYVVWISFINVATPELSVARVGQRIREAGHPVPPEKIRSRYRNLQDNVLQSIPLVDRLSVIDNSEQGRALRDVLLFEQGAMAWQAGGLPLWARKLFVAYLRSEA